MGIIMLFYCVYSLWYSYRFFTKRHWHGQLVILMKVIFIILFINFRVIIRPHEVHHCMQSLLDMSDEFSKYAAEGCFIKAHNVQEDFQLPNIYIWKCLVSNQHSPFGLKTLHTLGTCHTCMNDKEGNLKVKQDFDHMIPTLWLLCKPEMLL